MVNVKSTVNLTGIANSSYNQKFTVTGISSARTFVVGLTTDPGTFNNDTSARTTSLPYFKRKQYSKTYYSYRSEESQKYVPGEQDGVYYLTLINASNTPTASPFTNESFLNQYKNFIHKQIEIILNLIQNQHGVLLIMILLVRLLLTILKTV